MRNLVSPLDGSVLECVPQHSVADLNVKIDRSASIQNELHAQPRWQRIAWLQELNLGFKEKRPDIVSLMAHEVGKPLMLARAEVDRASALIEQTIAELMTDSGQAPYVDDQPAHATRTVISQRFPIGTIAAITPFNFPVNLVFHKVLPAIATGCPVIVKPSERTHGIAKKLLDIFAQTSMPEGAVQFVFADDGPEHARHIAADSRIALLSFTGSAQVGSLLAREAFAKPQILELGGSAAVYVASDADVTTAAKKCAAAAMAYAGQVCISVQRIYVHADVYTTFRDALLSEVDSIVPLDPRLDNHILGPMIDNAAASKFLLQCDGLRPDQVLRSSSLEQGRFVSPMVLTDIDSMHPMIQTEAFAPVVVLEQVTDIEEALVKMNGTPYGLQNGIFTQRLNDALMAQKILRGGAVYVNDVPSVRIDKLSYGGDGISGRGREGVREVMQAYTTPRHLVFS